MIGHYSPAASKEELIYSRTARTSALLFDGPSARNLAGQVDGAKRLFGGYIPRNVALLQEHFPASCAISSCEALAGSGYHMLAPFWDNEAREKLRAFVFSGDSSLRLGKLIRPLKFCVLCAREDRRAGRPQHWRVIPNHPAVTCCDKHRRMLVVTAATLSPATLHDPSVWIDPDAPVPKRAPSIEVAIAQDVRWLHDQRSTMCPGDAVNDALLRLLHRRYPLSCWETDERFVRAELKSRMAATVMRIDPDLLEPRRRLLRRGSKYSCLHRFFLLCQLVGGIREVFDECKRRSTTNCGTRKRDPLGIWKLRLVAAINAHPKWNRTDVWRNEMSAAISVRQFDPDFFELIMPDARKEPPNGRRDWPARDRTYAVRLARVAKSESTHVRRNIGRLVAAAELSYTVFKRNPERLPRTHAIVRRIVREAIQISALEVARRRLVRLIRAHPGLKRTDYKELDSGSVRLVRKNDPKLYERLMPPTRLARRSTFVRDWKQKDQRFFQALQGARGDGQLSSHMTARQMLAAAGLSSSSLDSANGRLPQTQSLLRTILAQHQACSAPHQ